MARAKRTKGTTPAAAAPGAPAPVPRTLASRVRAGCCGRLFFPDQLRDVSMIPLALRKRIRGSATLCPICENHLVESGQVDPVVLYRALGFSAARLQKIADRFKRQRARRAEQEGTT